MIQAKKILSACVKGMLLCVVGNGLSELEPFMEHPSHSKANLEIETMIPNP